MIALGPPTHHGALEFHWLGRVSYAEALELQCDLAARRRAGEIPDTVLLLEHEPVYTIGRTPDKTSLAGTSRALPHPVVEISRGGQADLPRPGAAHRLSDPRPATPRPRPPCLPPRARRSAHRDVCRARADATARPGLTGVWIESRKLASIGVGVRHWVSLHGFALNVTGECLAGFHAIVPCGIAGVEMTCLERELERPVTVRDLAEAVQAPIGLALGRLRQ